MLVATDWIPSEVGMTVLLDPTTEYAERAADAEVDDEVSNGVTAAADEYAAGKLLAVLARELEVTGVLDMLLLDAAAE